MSKDRSKILDGNIWKEMLIFVIPIFLSYLFQNLYNSVDSAIVGNYVSKQALAAVSNCATVTNIMVGFFTGLSSGALTIFSRYYGSAQYDKLDKSIHTSITFSIVFGLLMAIAGFFSSGFLLQLMAFPDEILIHAQKYLQIYFLGSVFTALFNIASGISRSIGDSKTPFRTLVITTFVNALLDIILIKYLNWQVIGAAVSTVVAQFVSCVLIMISLVNNKKYFDIKLRKLELDQKYLKEIFSKGLPAGVQSCLISLSNSLLQRYVNNFSTDIITGIGVAKKVDAFVAMPCQSIGIATATFVSQNFGANNKKRIKESVIAASVMMVVSVTVMVAPTLLNVDMLVGLFNKDPGVIEAGSAMVKVIAPLYYFFGFMEIFVGINRGFGKAIPVMIFSTMSMIVIRQIFLAIVFSFSQNIFFIHICYPMCWAIAMLFNVIYYFTVVRKKYMR
ncbi:MAG: MATE family efflux transporter [Erysipelotrichaceae bacterium]|nr:MATE family efflux transporter [Erysipelotrichaceae bacterium]